MRTQYIREKETLDYFYKNVKVQKFYALCILWIFHIP